MTALQKTRPDFYRLRWRFEFADRPARRGVWNLESDRPDDAAWRVPKAGLVYAVIEGENIRTFETVRFFECPGPDYITCKGNAYTRTPGAIGLSVAAFSPRPILWAISFLTRTELVAVTVIGELWRRPATTDEHRAAIHEHSILGVNTK